MSKLDKARSRIGTIWKNQHGLKAKIIGISEKRSKSGNVIFFAKFIETGYEFETELRNLKSGHFKDYGRPTVYGVGYSCSGGKANNYRAYKTWSHMLERCYNKYFHSYHRYGGRGVKVCERWLKFKNFELDIVDLPNYDKYIVGEKYTLDKDIRGDSTLYSPETCMFASYKEQSHAQDRVKKVKAIDNRGVELFFNSKIEACKALGVQNANLYKVLNGERKHTLGYRFEEVI